MALLNQEGIGRNHFYDERLAIVYQRIKSMLDRKVKVDLVTLQDELSRHGELQGVGGILFLNSLMDAVPSAAALEYYLPRLKDSQQRRCVLEASHVLSQTAQNREVDPEELLAQAEKTVKQLRRSTVKVRLSVRKPSEIRAQELDSADNILGDRLLAKGQALTLLGPGGIGKSRLLLQMAASCILGRSFVGLRTHNRALRWLILQAENSTRRLQVDLDRLFQWAGPDQAARLDEQLLIHTIDEEADTWLNLDSAAVRRRITELVLDTRPDVVCFDPLNCFTSGDLNNDREMRMTCQRISGICRTENPQRAIVVLHHSLTGKAGVARATGFERTGFGRNSKLLQAWTRGQINLAPASAENNERLIISCGKCSNGQEFPTYALKLDPRTMIYAEDYEFDLAFWQSQFEEGQNKEALMRQTFRECCAAPVSRRELVEKLINTKGLPQTTAYRQVNLGLQQGWLKEENDLLLAA